MDKTKISLLFFKQCFFPDQVSSEDSENSDKGKVFAYLLHCMFL